MIVWESKIEEMVAFAGMLDPETAAPTTIEAVVGTVMTALPEVVVEA